MQPGVDLFPRGFTLLATVAAGLTSRASIRSDPLRQSPVDRFASSDEALLGATLLFAFPLGGGCDPAARVSRKELSSPRVRL